MEESKHNNKDKSPTDSGNKPSGMKTWLGRMGIGAFLFFFIKGLVWLAIFFGLFKACN